MTAIVGVEHDGAVWMGSDSCLSWRGTTTTTAVPKVWLNGQYVIGGAGDMAAVQLLQFALKLPKPSGDPDKFAQMVVAKAVVKCLEGHIRKPDAWCLVGFNGRVYCIDSKGAATRNQCGYDASGTGSDYALGSLNTSARSKKMGPKRRIQLALLAASDHCTSVAPPFTILSV